LLPDLMPPQRGQNPAALNATVRINLTGVLRNDEISFTSRVDDPNGLGNVGPFATNNAARGQVTAVRPAVAQQMGAFGALIPQKFTVRRAATAVSGRIAVDAPSVPRPVFQLSFVSASGRRISPITRDVWNSQPPQTAMAAVNRPIGSAFDAVARFETNTLPGNPSTFVARLPAGEYRPTIAGLPEGFTVKSIRSGSVDLSSTNLRIVDGAAPPDLVIVLGITAAPPWGRLGGKVLNAAARTAERGGNIGGKATSAPTAVVLASRAYSEFWIAPVRSDGSFEFSRILPGEYELHGFPDTPATSLLKVTVPPAANLNVDITLPDVKALPCPAC
jgi:hypothetical protein